MMNSTEKMQLVAHKVPDEPFVLVCLKPPSLAHAFIIPDRTSICQLAYKGGFRYQARVDLDDAVRADVYAEAPTHIQESLRKGAAFTYALFTSGPKWFPLPVDQATTHENLALEAIREEYGKILFVRCRDAAQGEWVGVPDEDKPVAIPAINKALTRHEMAQVSVGHTRIH